MITISKEKKNTLHIASCSFGKDSLATILLALEHGEPLDEAVYCEVMFDKRTSGEVPEHRAFIYETAIPRLEQLGVPVRVLRSDKTYLDLFAGTVTRGPKKGLRRGFPLCGHCYVQRDCKLRPIRRYNRTLTPDKADDGTVKIESVDQDELKKQLETDSTAQIDVSGLEAEKVTLPVSAVNDVLDLEAKALSIKMADAAITLDKTAMQSVVETADGNDIQLHVSTGDALSSDQTEIIGDIEQGMVLDVSLTANGTEIHSFNGKVTVSVPFTWTQQGVLQAWYLADDGTKEPVEVAYRDGNAVLTLKHFSTYAIVVKANDPDSGIVSMGENEVTVQKQADAVYYAAALYAEDGRFLAYAASEAAGDEGTVTLKWANADWSKAAKVKVFFLDADRKPVAEAVTALIKGKSQKN